MDAFQTLSLGFLKAYYIFVADTANNVRWENFVSYGEILDVEIS